MIVITTGKKYIDIDGYASCIAYRELLRLRGIEARCVSSASANYSVTKSLRELPYQFDDYEVEGNDEFIIIDLSNKAFFENFVREEKIIELIDHHPGYEDYWEDLLGDNVVIDSIGSVATIIVEKYEHFNLLDKMNVDIAKLLMAAILDNTLNFTANITKKRDIDVYKKLRSITKLYDFQENYFSECQSFIESNLEDSIKNDLKMEKVNVYLPEVLGQLTVWDVDSILKRKEDIINIFANYGNEWLINIISLKENKSYIYCSNELISKNMKKLFVGTVDKNVFIITPAKLRKEIIKKVLLK